MRDIEMKLKLNDAKIERNMLKKAIGIFSKIG